MARSYEVVVDINRVSDATAPKVYQWDYGVILTILNAPSSGSYDAHFGIDGMKTALLTRPLVDGTTLTVEIPAALLMQSKTIHCYLYSQNSEPAYGYTVQHIIIPVEPRPQPATTEYTPEQIAYFDELVEQLEREIATVEGLKTSVTEALSGVNAALTKVNSLEFAVDTADGCLYYTMDEGE